jgi:hypothetical protein
MCKGDGINCCSEQNTRNICNVPDLVPMKEYYCMNFDQPTETDNLMDTIPIYTSVLKSNGSQMKLAKVYFGVKQWVWSVLCRRRSSLFSDDKICKVYLTLPVQYDRFVN